MSAELLQKESTKIYQGELTVSRIKDIFVARCYTAGIYVPIKNFLREIKVEFSSNVETLAIGRFREVLKLLINRVFIETHCENESDIADCIMHEVFHHLLRHVNKDNRDKKNGINQDVLNCALDSIVNAHLAQINSAGFFVRYYPDEVPYAFLRLDSENFSVPRSNTPQKQSLIKKIVSFRFGREKVDSNLLQTYKSFYDQLYNLKVTQEEATTFFQELFLEEQQESEIQFIGGHGDTGASCDESKPDFSDGQEEKQQDEGSSLGKPSADVDPGNDSPSSIAEERDSPQLPASTEHAPTSSTTEGNDSSSPLASEGHGRSEGSIFDLNEIRNVLMALGLEKATKRARNNFAQVIQRIKTLSNKPGKFRHGTIYSRRLPARLNRRDLLSIERGRYLFERGDFKSQEVLIFFDYSGSMSVYKKFVIDLTRSLKRDGKIIRVIIWADGIKEIPHQQFLKGEIPNVGSGTQGEQVAQFLHNEKVEQCVIVTDNVAGTIETKISARVFLALVKGGTGEGSFADRAVVPDREIFWLEP